MKNDLYEKLTRLQWLLHKQRMHGYHGGGHLADTTRGQGRILAALQMKDGISTRDLSYLLGLAVSSLNEFLSKLEKGGYITREPSEQDGRVMLVKLTEKGKAQQGNPETLDFGDIFDCLTPEEQQAFGGYLDRVIAALQAKVGYDDEEAIERLHAVQAERERLYTEGFGGFDRRGSFGRFGHGRGCGFPDHRYGCRGRDDREDR